MIIQAAHLWKAIVMKESSVTMILRLISASNLRDLQEALGHATRQEEMIVMWPKSAQIVSNEKSMVHG